MADAGLVSISEVAQATGLRASALRYYEEEGLVRPAARIGGRRHYERSVLQRLAIIALCQEAGFTIAEISDLLGRKGGSRERWRRLAERKLAEVDEHIQRAQATRRLLRDVLACGCGDPASCEMVGGATTRRTLTIGRKEEIARRRSAAP